MGKQELGKNPSEPQRTELKKRYELASLIGNSNVNMTVHISLLYSIHDISVCIIVPGASVVP